MSERFQIFKKNHSSQLEKGKTRVHNIMFLLRIETEKIKTWTKYCENMKKELDSDVLELEDLQIELELMQTVLKPKKKKRRGRKVYMWYF